MLRGRRHLHRREQEAAVAADRHHWRVGLGALGAERGGISPAERALVAGREERARLVGRIGEAGGVSHLGQLIDQDAVFGQCLADGVQIGDLRRQRLANPLRGGSLDLGDGLGAAVPFGVVLCQTIGQRLQRCGRIAHDADLGLALAIELLAVDIDANDLERIVEAPILLLRLQTRADSKHDIGLAPEAIAGRHGDRQFVPAIQHALAHASGHDRRIEHFGDQADELASILRTTADHDHRSLGGAQQLGRALDGLIIDGAGVGLGRRRDQLHRRAPRPRVHGALQGDRTPPSREEAAERLVDQAGRFGRGMDAIGPFGETAHDRQLIGQLVQQADVAADHRLLDLARERQHRRVDGIGRRQCRRRVQKSRPRDHDIGGRAAGRHGMAQRHVGAGLLVPGMDRADRIGAIVQGVEERIVLNAWQTIDRVDAVYFQHRHDGLGRGERVVHPPSLHGLPTCG